MQGKIKSLEQIFLFSLPVKEYQIVENFLGSALKDEVMKIMPVQKQTRAGQRTRFKVRSSLPLGNGISQQADSKLVYCQSFASPCARRAAAADCRRLWLWATTMDTWVLASSAPRR